MTTINRRIVAVALAGTLAVSSGLLIASPSFASSVSGTASAASEAAASSQADDKSAAVADLTLSDEVAAENSALAEQIAADPEGTHTVTDVAGNDVEIPNTVTSIVVPFPAATQCVFGLGGADLLSGCYILDTDMNDIMFGQYRDTTVEISPSDINAEVVMNCDPDFAIVPGQSQADAIAETGTPTLMYSGADFESMKASVEMIAEAIGTQDALDKADKYGLFYDALVDEVSSMTGDVADEDRPSVFVCTEDDGLSSFGADSMISDWVELSGGVSICDELGVEGGEITLTSEQILQADPDIIICVTVAGRDAIVNDPAYADVSAIKNGKVYVNPLGGSVWFKAHFEAPLELAWAPTVIQPELAADLDTRAWVDEFYETFYGYEVTDEDYDVIMNPTVGSR
jgi:iron complex transport system substrate-binding protein